MDFEQSSVLMNSARALRAIARSKAKEAASQKRKSSKEKAKLPEPEDAATIIYDITKNALGPPSPPPDEDLPEDDLPLPSEVRIRASQHATVPIVDTPLVSASVSNGILTYRFKKCKRDGELDNEFLARLMRTETESEFHTALSESVQRAAQQKKAEDDAARAAPKLARKRRRVEKAKRTLERLAELNTDDDELYLKTEEGDEDEDEDESEDEDDNEAEGEDDNEAEGEDDNGAEEVHVDAEEDEVDDEAENNVDDEAEVEIEVST
ncbi:hypothetical protein ACHAQA_003550 [Verticillium albo-atrum]